MFDIDFEELRRELAEEARNIGRKNIEKAKKLENRFLQVESILQMESEN